MPRRRVIAKREILPDPKYGNELLARFMNVVMVDGKKSTAEAVVYGALEQAAKSESNVHVESESNDEASRVLAIFKNAIDKIRPSVEVRSRRVGGATYQVPVEVRPERSIALAMRWLVQAARGRGEKGMVNRLAAEILDAINGRGVAIKKREDTHRMAEANRAFAHFRW